MAKITNLFNQTSRAAQTRLRSSGVAPPPPVRPHPQTQLMPAGTKPEALPPPEPPELQSPLDELKGIFGSLLKSARNMFGGQSAPLSTPGAAPQGQQGPQEESLFGKLKDAVGHAHKRMYDQNTPLHSYVRDVKELKQAGMMDDMEGTGLSKMMSKGVTVARAAAGDPLAMASLAMSKAKEVKDDIQGVGKGFGRAFKGETVGEIGGGLGAAGAKMAKLGGLGPIAEGSFKLLGLMSESIDKLREFGEQLHNSNMKFAEFSSSMARVQAEQEIRDIHLSQQRGERRAETAGYLAEQKSRLAAATAPWEDTWANMKNELFGYLNKKAADVIESVNKWTEFLAGNDSLTDTPYEGLTTGLVGQSVGAAVDDWTSTYGRPMHMMPEGTFGPNRRLGG